MSNLSVSGQRDPNKRIRMSGCWQSSLQVIISNVPTTNEANTCEFLTKHISKDAGLEQATKQRPDVATRTCTVYYYVDFLAALFP